MERDSVRAPHYTVVEDTVIDDDRVSGNGMLVYLALRRHVNADGSCWPSWARIARVSRLKRTAVADALLEIEAAGYIHREPRAGQSSLYTVTIPVRSADSPRPLSGLPPVRSADPEVSPLEVHPLKENTSPSGDTPEEVLEGVSKSVAKRHAIQGDTKKRKRSDMEILAFDATWEATKAVHGAPMDGKREPVSLWSLIDYCKKADPVVWADFLRAMLDTALKLKSGKIKTKGEFWVSMPYIPSMLYGRRQQIVEFMRAKKPDADPFAEYAHET